MPTCKNKKNHIFLVSIASISMLISNLAYTQTRYEQNSIDYKYRKNFDKGADINSADKNGQNPLIKAAIAGDEQAVDFLIKINANINARDNEGNTALHYAAKNNHHNVVQKLVDNGAYKNVTNYAGYTPLDMAGSYNSVESYRILQDQMAKPNLNSSTSRISNNTYLWAGAGALAAIGAVALAAGGGSSSTKSTGENESGVIGTGGGNSDDEESSNDGSSNDGSFTINQAEYSNQAGLNLINADAAYNRGYSGAGVKVAVIDSGVAFDHPELNGNIDKSLGATFENGTKTGIGDAVNNEDHGTHVAGIIANSNNNEGTLGVAFGAQIIPINVETSFFGIPVLGSEDIALGVDHAVASGARVINMSLGGPSDDLRERVASTNALSKTGSESILIAAATGNDGNSQSGYPAQYAGESVFNEGVPDFDDNIDDGGVILAVGAVDTEGNIASFSDRCGITKNWCLVAPGTNILSSTEDGGLSRFSGTSMATPHVSGAAAILMEMDPQLSAREVGEILLLTADPLGSEEISDIYGHGLLNLEKATRPVGFASIPLGDDVDSLAVSLDATRFTTSGVFGDAVSNSNLSFAILDSYNRDFTMDLSNINDGENRLRNFEQNLQNFSNDITQNRKNLGENLSFASDQIKNYNQGVDQKEKLHRFSLSANYDKYNIDINSNVAMNQSFRMKALDDVAMATDNVGNNSVLGLVTTGFSNNNTYRINKNTSLSFGSFRSEEDYGDVFGAVSEYNYAKDKYNLGLQFGMINEKNSLLGGKMSGAFALNDNTSTWFSSLASVLKYLEFKYFISLYQIN